MAKKILVIEDEVDIQTFLTTLLRRNGYETVVASNGTEGLEVGRSEKPDLVILDLSMPSQSGTDFYRTSRRDDDLKSIPIIVVSGMAGRHLAVKDAVAVFDKPINEEAFLAAVQEALE
jgi:CheY-like chemotaxis protein